MKGLDDVVYSENLLGQLDQKFQDYSQSLVAAGTIATVDDVIPAGPQEGAGSNVENNRGETWTADQETRPVEKSWIRT